MTEITLPEPFVNEAGSIQNLLMPKELLGFVSIIHSKKGSRRSSHMHKRDCHYLYVLSGTMRYRWRRPGEKPEPWQDYGPGSLVFTPQLIEHWTEFPEDTVMVSFSKLPRDTANHERDVVRVPWPED